MTSMKPRLDEDRGSAALAPVPPRSSPAAARAAARTERWAERLARPAILLALVSLLIVPAPFGERTATIEARLRSSIDPARVGLELLPLTWAAQSAAARGALAEPEHLPAYREAFARARQRERELVESLNALAERSSPELLAGLERIEATRSRWRTIPHAYFTGELDDDHYRDSFEEQDALRASSERAWQRTLDEAIAISDAYEAELRRLARIQQTLTLLLVILALIAAALVVWLDARSRELPAARREQLLAERAASVRASVLAQVSHDLKSPLTAVLLTCRALLPRVRGKDDQIAAGLVRIERSARRMEGMVSDLVDAARRGAGLALKFDVAPTDVRPLIERVVEESDDGRAGRIIVDLPRELPPVLANGAKVERVLQNLIGNALKFSPQGSEVRVSAVVDVDDVRLRVLDQGPGIAPRRRAQVFEAFWQADETAAKGSGLGLSIAKGIVEAHGGDIWIESGEEHGSVVAFTLPRASDTSRPDA